MTAISTYNSADIENDTGDVLEIKVFSNAIDFKYGDVEWELNHDTALELFDVIKASLDNT